MPPRQVRGHARSLTRARGDHEEGDDNNHQESVMGEEAPPEVFGGTEFMQEVFTAIEQVVRNTVQIMQVSIRIADYRATTAIKAFL